MGTSSFSSVVSEKQPQRPKWRPISLSARVLIPLISYTILLMVALGVLQRKSDRDGGILFADSVEDMPFSYIFIQNYLPTITAVLYNTICVWIDLDVKRLEPWYNLSQKTGASGENSVLLDYPAEFLPLVPLKSVKNRQWTVLSSSLIVLLASWVVTPLQSGIFALRTIQKREVVPMDPPKSLIPFEDQANKLSMEFMNLGYNVGWLNMSMPPFTTRSYALAPFEPRYEHGSLGRDRKWTGNTVLYEADLSCELPKAVYEEYTVETPMTFDDGRGCIAKRVMRDRRDDPGHVGYYIGYWGDGGNVRSIEPFWSLNASCDENSLHEALAYWRCPNMTIAALFCWSKYYAQDVEAIISDENKSVIGVRAIGEKKLLPDNVFDSTRFEQIITTQSMPDYSFSESPQTPLIGKFDISGLTTINPTSKLSQFSVVSPEQSLVPSMLGIFNASVEELCFPDRLADAYRKTYKVLFALAVQSVLSESNANASDTTVILEFSVGAVTMVGIFAYLVIGFLAVITVLFVCLLCAYRGRVLNLPYSPNSIGSILGIAQHQMNGHSVFRDLSSANDVELRRKLQDVWFHLEDSDRGIKLRSEYVKENDREPYIEHVWFVGDNSKKWPWPLYKTVGMVFLALLTAILLTVFALRYLIWRLNGLPLFSNDDFLLQLILNYFPTVIATIIEPFWTVLNRLMCAIQPFISLKSRETLATRSILLEYTSVPPQLAVWRALRSHHWLLAAVCVIAIAANVLTIGMSGLFDIRETTVNHSINANQLMQPSRGPNASAISFKDRDYGNPMQQMLANLSNNVPMLPWVTPEYFFFPVSLPVESRAPMYQVSTTGLGSDLECSEVMDFSVSGANMTYTFYLSHDAMQANFTFREKFSNGTQIRCYYPGAFIPDDAKADDEPPPEETQVYLRGNPEGRQGLEFLVIPYPSFNTKTPDEIFFCGRMIVAGWVRANITLGEGFSETLYGPTRNISEATLDSMFMKCRPRFMIGNFSVVTDRDGRVLNYTQVGDLSEDIEWGLADEIWRRTFALVEPPAWLRWHNDTYAGDWFNKFIKVIAGNADIIDPLKPKPDFTTAATLTSTVYRQLFAITARNNPDFFAKAPSGTTTAAIEIFNEQRVFMNDSMFFIVVVVLAANIAVASFLYVGLPKPFLHHMPTSIAGLLSYCCGSHLAEDLSFGSHAASSKAELYANLARQNYKYRLSNYIGTDDSVHFGIDRQPYLLPERQPKPRRWARLRRKLLSTRPSGHDVI